MRRVGLGIGSVLMAFFVYSACKPSHPQSENSEIQLASRPQTAPSHCGSSYFEGKNKIPIHFQYHTRPGNAKAIVFLTGRKQTHRQYQDIYFAPFLAAGFDVYAMDHRGQGCSGRLLPDPEKGHVESFEDYKDDLKIFIRYLVNPRGDKRLYFFGHSMGGLVGLLHAKHVPGTFKALALTSPQLGLQLILGHRGSQLLLDIQARLASGRTDYAPRQGPHDPQVYTRFENNDYTTSREGFERFGQVFTRFPEAALCGPTNQWLTSALSSMAIKGGHEFAYENEEITRRVISETLRFFENHP